MTDAYRRIAPWYDRLLDPFIRSWRVRGLDLFNPGKGAAVLEVGCGTGAQLAYYRAHGHRATGIDMSSAMLGVARARLGGRAIVCLGDGARLPYPDGSFDLVLASLVLHEMEPGTRSAVLEDMVRVLRPEGCIGIIDYHPLPKRTVKGLGTRLLMRGIEWSAGRRHYANYRHFLTNGGIFPPVKRLGLIVEDLKRASGGNIGIYRLRRGP
jgi:ubiquinone/menaquinone biosynthesis C-methylase UbiE